MIIEKHYGETVEFTKNRWIKLGITIKSDTQLTSTDEIKAHSKKLLLMGEKLIQDDIVILKQKEENNG